MNSSRAVNLPRYLQMVPQHPPAWPVSQGRTWRRHLLKCHHHDPGESLTQQGLERGSGDFCKRGKHKATRGTGTSLILGADAKGQLENWNKQLLIAARRNSFSSHVAREAQTGCVSTSVLQMCQVGCREGNEETKHRAYPEGKRPLGRTTCHAVSGKKKMSLRQRGSIVEK